MNSTTLTLVILTIINLLNYVDRWLVSSVIPLMERDLHLSYTQDGLIMSAFMLGYIVTSPLFGYLADRKRRLNLVAAGTVVWSIATFLSGLGKSWAQIFAGRIVIGVGEASTVSAGQSLIVDLYPPRKRNVAMGYFTLAIPVGAALGFELGGFLAPNYGWRSAFFVAGIPGLLFACVLPFLKEPKRGAFDEGQSANIDTEGFVKDVLNLFKNRSYTLAVLGYSAYTFCLGGFASWAASYLVKVRGMPLHDADMMFGALTVVMGALGSIAGGYAAAWCAKKFVCGDLKFLAWSTLAAAPFAFGTFLFPSKTIFLICIAMTEFLLFLGQPVVNVAIMECVGPFLRGIATATAIFMIHVLGDLISPTLVGFLADRFSLNTAILVLPTALFPAAFLYWLCMKSTQQSRA